MKLPEEIEQMLYALKEKYGVSDIDVHQRCYAEDIEVETCDELGCARFVDKPVEIVSKVERLPMKEMKERTEVFDAPEFAIRKVKGKKIELVPPAIAVIKKVVEDENGRRERYVLHVCI